MDEAKRNALHYLKTHQVMTVATYGAEGVWAAAVFYVNVDFDLYFLSAGHTRHAQNFLANPRVAATIQEDYEGWQNIQGIQLAGMVRLLTGGEKDTAVKIYSDKYPFITQKDPQLEEALARVNWYHLRADRFYFIDNQKGLGHRDEIALD